LRRSTLCDTFIFLRGTSKKHSIYLASHMRSIILTFLVIAVACGQKPEDRFTEIRGKRQHVLDVGAGRPAVVFVSGFGDRVSSWMSVQRKVAELTRTISYDRAGLGESEMLSADRSLDTLVFELNEILKKEKVEPPYILVGHSYGGHIIRYFAHKHPDRVAGLVLVDATVEHMEDEFKRTKTLPEIKSYDSLSEHGRDPNWADGVRREADYFKKNNDTMKGIPFNKNIPGTIITALNTPESDFRFLKGVNEMKVNLHKRWVAESPHLKHVFANKSGHYVQFDEPQLVINEIKALINARR
jgi:pimeloyl-ACP methyl ester carboxylesterase